MPLSLAIVSGASAFDRRFDVVTFYQTAEGSANHLVQAQFDRLNWTSPNGHQLMMGTDNHRSELNAAGNSLGAYYNTLTQLYTDSGQNYITAADTLNQYELDNHTHSGAAPTWISLNEISVSLWGNNASYRQWLINTVTRLHDVYGRESVVFSPYAYPGTPGNPLAPDWIALSQHAYIGIEQYLNSANVKANGFTATWCQQHYFEAVDGFTKVGVDPSRLIMGENFAQSTTGTTWGRGGLPIDEWVQVINARSDAIRNVGCAGFISYGWSQNQMGVSDAEMNQAIEAYRSHIVVESEGPRWNVDAGGSWGTAGNWLSPFVAVPPNGASQVANFVKSLASSRTVTLDAPRTVGRITFDSANSYVIASGGAGANTLTLANNTLATSITVASGSHQISAPIALTDDVNVIINGTALTLSGAISNTGTKGITKTGAGALTIAGAQSWAAGTKLNANAGVTNLNSDGGVNLTLNANATVNFGSSQKIAALTIASGKVATLTAGGAKVLNTGTLTVTGKLDLKDNDAIIRNGALGSLSGSTYTGITGLIATGRNGGNWNAAAGITTSSATGLLTGLGVATASQAKGITSTQTATWNGQTVTGSNVLVMYTYGGDANLDGKLNIDDYVRIDSSIPQNLTGWFNGDFNYDGKINIDDYTIIDGNVGNQSGWLGNAASVDSVIAVPEPAAGAVCISSVMALRRRRRCKR